MEYKKMKKLASEAAQWLKHTRDLVLGFLMVTVIPMAHAALPPVAPPSGGATKDGNYLGMIKAYLFDGFAVAGLALVSVAFLVVAKNTFAAYSEVTDGNGTWRQVFVQAGVGALLLVIAIYMLTDSVDVLK